MFVDKIKESINHTFGFFGLRLDIHSHASEDAFSFQQASYWKVKLCDIQDKIADGIKEAIQCSEDQYERKVHDFPWIIKV
jgi:hypothetical protein